MRMTKNKKQVMEALSFVGAVNAGEGFPPYSATDVQEILKDHLGYGDFDLPNLTRTLKALVLQGLVKQNICSIDVIGNTGCIEGAWVYQDRPCYWPADLDLDALRLERHGTPEEIALSREALLNLLCGMR